MTDLIARSLERVRGLFTPRTRGCDPAAPGAEVLRWNPRVIVRPWNPPQFPRPGGRRFAEPIDGDATALVRPYLVAYEQRERRTALLLALDGIDMPGPVWIHGVEVAA